MIYTVDIIGDQWNIFLKAAELGAILGICYDFLRVLRTLVRFGKKLFAASDFVFCLWSAFLIFSFLLNENFGIPRFYIFFGISCGFCLWYFTMGRVNFEIAKLLRKILKTVFRPFIKIFRNIIKFTEKPFEKAKIILLNKINKLKSLLKKKAGMVYNVLCLNVSKAFSFCGEKAGKEPEDFESSGTEKNKKGNFSENSGNCLRGIPSFFADNNPGKHQ